MTAAVEVRDVFHVYESPEGNTAALQGLTVALEETELCPRYAAAVVEVAAAVSPSWMVSRLEAAGIRPISPIVDITNYVLLELGQPTHALDLQKLAGPEIRGNAEMPNVGEALYAVLRALGALDDVVHHGAHQQLALLRRVEHHDPGVVVTEPLRLERRLERGGRPRILRRHRDGLVRDQPRLDGDPHVSLDRLDLVEDRRRRTLDK